MNCFTELCHSRAIYFWLLWFLESSFYILIASCYLRSWKSCRHCVLSRHYNGMCVGIIRCCAWGVGTAGATAALAPRCWNCGGESIIFASAIVCQVYQPVHTVLHIGTAGEQTLRTQNAPYNRWRPGLHPNPGSLQHPSSPYMVGMAYRTLHRPLLKNLTPAQHFGLALPTQCWFHSDATIADLCSAFLVTVKWAVQMYFDSECFHWRDCLYRWEIQ